MTKTGEHDTVDHRRRDVLKYMRTNCPPALDGPNPKRATTSIVRSNAQVGRKHNLQTLSEPTQLGKKAKNQTSGTVRSRDRTTHEAPCRTVPLFLIFQFWFETRCLNWVTETQDLGGGKRPALISSNRKRGERQGINRLWRV